MKDNWNNKQFYPTILSEVFKGKDAEKKASRACLALRKDFPNREIIIEYIENGWCVVTYEEI